MSAKTVSLSNFENRPVVFRGNSGESFHLAPLERDREIRLLELEGNPMVEKLKRRRVLGIGEEASKAGAKKKKRATKRKKKTETKAKSGSGAADGGSAG